MTLSTAGALCEGIRSATGNNAFTFPARTIITDQSELDLISSRSEYLLIVSGQADGSSGLDIGDPALRFEVVKNTGSISRFGWDGYFRRWIPLPGAGPINLGIISNDPRISITVPDLSISFSEAPYALFIGDPSRLAVFTLSFVSSASSFTTPPPGTVEVSIDKGELNFSPIDLSNTLYTSNTLYYSRQSFFDRTKNTGSIGQLPFSLISYKLYLNPVPSTAQTPRIRIGYGRYLDVVSFPFETSVPDPPSGTVYYTLDTGRVIISPADIAANFGEFVYYDGVTSDSIALTRATIGPCTYAGEAWPTPTGTRTEFVGLTDSNRYKIFAEKDGNPRYYFEVNFVNTVQALLSFPAIGTANIDTATGKVYLNPLEPILLPGYSLKFVDSIVEVETGVSIQVFRSGVNSSGLSSISDFVEFYDISQQLLVDGITSSPFIFLPTIPIVDSNISYSIDVGPGSGSFIGDLVNVKDPTKFGTGYFLDLDKKQLKFAERKTTTIFTEKPVPSIVLSDKAIFNEGLEIQQNDVVITQGSDFIFDPNAGVLQFVEPVGEQDELNIDDIQGTISLPNIFIAPGGTFPSTSQAGKFLFISSGPNFGYYEVQESASTTTLVLKQNFVSAGPQEADFKNSAEVVVDRFWDGLLPPFKKISVELGDSISGPFTTLNNSQFSVLPTTGQINLNTPIQPSHVVRVTYTSLDSQDFGVTVTATSHTEFAGFKVRRETCLYAPNSRTAFFNTSGKTVLTDFPISVTIDGVTQDSSQIVFVAPNQLNLGTQLISQSVIVDYFIAEATGGETTFNLLHTPIDIDFPTILGTDSGSSNPTSTLSGDQTSRVKLGSAILADNKDIFIVSSVSYDSNTDLTSITLESPPSTTIKNVPLKVSQPIIDSYMKLESSIVDIATQGTNNVSISGNLSYYRIGTVIKLSSDSYYVASVKYDQSTNKTILSLSSSLRQNYLIPTLQYSVRPIADSSTELQTSKSAISTSSHSLVRIGNVDAVLRPEIDYTLSDGGKIQLLFTPSYGDSLVATYVARRIVPTGTKIYVNYAHAISPDASGLTGQRLLSTYKLYNPDSFYYRTETIESFLPEVSSMLRSSSSTSSGPNTSGANSLKNQDFGIASPYFDEQHLSNVDVVVARLLKFYNDLINNYEDCLANLDGRVVGQLSGRLRFDGNLSNPVRNSYVDVTNDIDDQIKIYDGFSIISFVPFQFSTGPVYSPMWKSSPKSRFFPTSKLSTIVLANAPYSTPQDLGKIIGNFGVTKLTSFGTFNTTPARSEFVSVSGNSITLVNGNGDTTNLGPNFQTGQTVKIYSDTGALVTSGLTISTISGSNPTVLGLSGAPGVNRGSVVQDVSVSNPPLVNYYGSAHLSVDGETGDIKFNQFPAPIGPTNNVIGNELVDCNITYLNQDIVPKNIPVLNGIELLDSGQISNPIVSYPSELNLISRESSAISSLLGFAKVSALLTTVIDSTLTPSPGDSVQFLDGPNAGAVRTVLLVTPPSFTVTVAFPSIDISGTSTLYKIPPTDDIFALIAQEESVLSTSTASSPTSPDLIGTVQSETSAINTAIESYGPIIASGIATVTSTTLIDTGANFLSAIDPVTTRCLIFISSGINHGLYKITNVTATILTIDTVLPYQGFTPGSVSYQILEPWSFLTDNQFGLSAEFLRETISFLNSTQSWNSSVAAGGVPARLATISSRTTKINDFIARFTSILSKEAKLYETRFLWIKQRIDKKEGLLYKKDQAQSKREEAIQKILDDQKKLLIMQGL